MEGEAQAMRPERWKKKHHHRERRRREDPHKGEKRLSDAAIATPRSCWEATPEREAREKEAAENAERERVVRD